MFGPWAPNGYLLVSIPPFRDIYIFFSHMLAMFGPWAPNGYLLASILPLGDIFKLFLSTCSLAPHGDIPSALRPCSPPHGNIPSTLRPRSPPHGDIPSALRPSSPLTMIFLRPCSHAPSRRNRFSIRLTASVDFIFLMPPHGKIDFLFAPRGM